jgi:hypothetical protein
MSLFGASDRNNDKRKQEIAEWKKYKKQYNLNEEKRKEEYDLARGQYEADIQYNEDNLRFTEKERVEQYRQEVARQDFEFNTATRVYDKSVEQANAQKSFNIMAETAAMMEQNAKNRDDLLGVMFDESDTLLEYGYATSGLKLERNNKLVAADFQEAKNEAKFTGDLGAYQIERRKARSESQIEAQKAIIEGMKAAGTIRAQGTAGRSSAKAVLGVMAESGALRANIANSLMYAEQGIDLGIAQLRDMLILDQTMVLAARDAANNDYTLKSTKLDSSLAVDKIKISATRQSIAERDAIVRKKISNARMQADLNAEASVMLAPQRPPAITNPQEFYAEYDNPETTDYIEMFMRPQYQEFPDYTPAPRKEYEKDFHYKLGRENAASSNFGDVLKIGGMVAGVASGVGTLAAGGLFGGAAAGSMLSSTGFLANGVSTFGTIGAGLNTLSSSFYPSYSR